MLRTFSLVTAAALLASVTAFAQTTTTNTTEVASSSPAASGDTDTGKMHHRHHHVMRSEKNGSDWDADKLNSCMSNATPTDSQESCLKQAEHS